MRLLLALLSLLITFRVAAHEVTSRIHEIDYSQNDETLIFLTSGKVLRLKATDQDLLPELTLHLEKKHTLWIQYSDERFLQYMKVIPSTQKPIPYNKSMKLFVKQTNYRPSILANLDQARSFFYDAQSNHKESQCYNRAHAWAYDWRVKRNLYSSKVWLFFTKRYIRKYKFEWWFHVAPMVQVIINNEVKERMMDIKYARGPIKLKTWTDIFMRDSADCPVVEKYSDQADYPESGTCFLMKSSMYYYQPLDLEQREVMGIEKSTWFEPEVRTAFLDAFDVQL